MKILSVENMGIAAAIIVGLVATALFLMHTPAVAPSGATAGVSPQGDLPAPALGVGQSVTELSSVTKKYTHALIGFSFTYPAVFTVSSFGSVYDSSGETILLQNDGGKKGLQVLVTPFDEDTVLTAVRIHRDIPDMVMSNVSPRILGAPGKSAQAIVFTSNNSLMGESREAWFVREKRLYQVSAPVDVGDTFSSVLDSWQF